MRLAEANWTVHVHAGAKGCSGAVISPTVVLTAAHCMFNRSGRPLPAAKVHVRAGSVTSAASPRAQERTAAAIRLYPSYSLDSDFYDVAAITLTERFTFWGGSVRPIAVARRRPPAGARLLLFGWGERRPGRAATRERRVTFYVLPQWACASGIPALTCAYSPRSDSCHGDSGGGLVRTRPLELVALASWSSSDRCRRGDDAGFTDLTNPDVRRWLAGDGHGPVAPRTYHFARITGRPEPGAVLTCHSAPWRGSPRLSYLFVEPDYARTLARRRRFRVPRALRGHSVACVSVARRAGSVTTAQSSDLLVIRGRWFRNGWAFPTPARESLLR